MVLNMDKGEREVGGVMVPGGASLLGVEPVAGGV